MQWRGKTKRRKRKKTRTMNDWSNQGDHRPRFGDQGVAHTSWRKSLGTSPRYHWGPSKSRLHKKNARGGTKTPTDVPAEGKSKSKARKKSKTPKMTDSRTGRSPTSRIHIAQSRRSRKSGGGHRDELLLSAVPKPRLIKEDLFESRTLARGFGAVKLCPCTPGRRTTLKTLVNVPWRRRQVRSQRQQGPGSHGELRSTVYVVHRQPLAEVPSSRQESSGRVRGGAEPPLREDPPSSNAGWCPYAGRGQTVD